jgi:hypothetical protein
MVGELAEYKSRYVVKKMPDIKGVSDVDKTDYIPCGKRSGLDHIYAISSTKLGLWLTGSQKIKKIMRDIRGLTMLQNGEGEAVLGFSPLILDQVAKFAKAKKRRHLSEEQKTRLVEAGKQSRF